MLIESENEMREALSRLITKMYQKIEEYDSGKKEKPWLAVGTFSP